MRGKRQPNKALQMVPINTRYQSGMFSLRSSRKETGGSDSFSFRFRCLLLRRERHFLVDGSSSSSSSASSSSNLTAFSNLKKKKEERILESQKLLLYTYDSTAPAKQIPSTSELQILPTFRLNAHCPDDDWSIQSKHIGKFNLPLHLCRSQLRSHSKVIYSCHNYYIYNHTHPNCHVML